MEPAYLRRHTQRGAYDVEAARSVFDDCFFAHVSYVADGLPVCMPMIALLRDEVDDVDEETKETKSGEARKDKALSTAVYLHGHPSTKLMELVRQASREDGTSPEPVKVCVTATKMDGLVLSSAPNGHTFNYRSATIHGSCEPVRSKVAKRTIMQAVTNKVVNGRWEEVNPVASMQVSLVYVVKVRIDRLSVKTRSGTAGIQPRNLEADGPDREPAPWTGVIPLWEQLGEPIESGLTLGAALTDNVRKFVAQRNTAQEAYAKEAARP